MVVHAHIFRDRQAVPLQDFRVDGVGGGRLRALALDDQPRVATVARGLGADHRLERFISDVAQKASVRLAVSRVAAPDHRCAGGGGRKA